MWVHKKSQMIKANYCGRQIRRLSCKIKALQSFQNKLEFQEDTTEDDMASLMGEISVLERKRYKWTQRYYHNFAILDGHRLLNGLFNWSKK
jgi:hypothetical protein